MKGENSVIREIRITANCGKEQKLNYSKFSNSSNGIGKTIKRWI